MASKRTKKKQEQSDTDFSNDDDLEIPSRFNEIIAFLLCIIALVLFLALISYKGLDSDGAVITDENIIGPVGTWLAYALFSFLGSSAYMLNIAVCVWAVSLFMGFSHKINWRGMIGTFFIVIFSSVLIHTITSGSISSYGYRLGGFSGALFGEFLISLFSKVGTIIIATASIIMILLVITDISLFLVFRLLYNQGKRIILFLWEFIQKIITTWQKELPVDCETVDEKKIPIIAIKQKESSSEKDVSINDEIEPRIITSKNRTKPKSSNEELPFVEPQIRGEFKLPPLSMLEAPSGGEINIDKDYLKQNAEKLIAVLSDFGISGEVKEIRPGPTVTIFEFQPRSGIKLSRIGGLSNEVAMALEVTRVRIVAPIPGKNAVGFELPNKERETVRLREIFEDDIFLKTKAALPMALGKDITGIPYCVDLAKMPHLLMAGTTGSGKSVSVNTMLLSFLFKHTPDELRLLLIDPKMIEFQPYNHIPHLLLPVVTDMSQACLALQWAVDEMERRYQLFADIGSKNLASYNAKVEKIVAIHEEEKNEPSDTAITENGSVVEFFKEKNKKHLQKLPLIVICIDELADLMMVAAKDVENSIARLAQKARASGIHLIVATQRPSTDVVTGLIKANFPARLSCQVSSGIDSRTILGTGGAEHLLGNGDMLIVPPGASVLHRVQGAFVSEEEVCDVVAFLKDQAMPEYDEEILKPRENADGDDIDDEEKDEMYDQAVSIVAQAQSCSISMLQRRLRIGYNRSARIVEIMEKEGIVGPANGVNKREVLISPQ